MIITVITIAKNEHDMMPFFIRHYQRFADRIVVYDESTDDTPDIVHGMGGEIIPMEPGNGIRDDIHATIKSQAGGKFGGDWTMVPDVDEFLYYPDMRGLLAEYQQNGVTLPHIAGYSMVGEKILTDGYLTDQLREGIASKIYSKRIVYHSNLAISYSPGAHKCRTSGEVPSIAADILLLHYKLAFGWDFVKRKLESVVLSPENIAHRWGASTQDIEAFRNEFNFTLANKRPVI